MENIEKELQKERIIVHEKRKILRTKPVILVRRYFLLFLVLFVFVITTVLGFYNIKRIEFTENENKYVKESDIRNLLNDFIGENFFLINPENAEEKIYTNSYVKYTEVEKEFPNVLKVTIEEYKPFLIFQTKDSKCKIFSVEGKLLETMEEVNCEEVSNTEDIIYFTGEDEKIVEEDGKEDFYLIDDIHDISLVLNSFGMAIHSVDMKENILYIYTQSLSVILDTNQDLLTELGRLYIVLEELEELGKQAVSVDVRFERPVLVIDN